MGFSRTNTMASLAATLLTRGKLAAAEATARDALALMKARETNPLTEATVLATLGRVLLARAKDVEAAAVLGQAIDLREARLGRDHPDVVRLRRYMDDAQRRLATRARREPVPTRTRP
jgi:hypothetical protein